ncbi:MAG: FeoA family protein [Verrucomicrobiota bacterium]
MMFKRRQFGPRRGVPHHDFAAAESQDGVPLTALTPGRGARVVRVGGFNMSRHLASLGIYPGTCLTLVRGGLGHAVIIEVGGTRLVVGRGMAPRILVKPEANCEENSPEKDYGKT